MGPWGLKRLGECRDLLRTGLSAWQGATQVAMIAGSLPLGLGVLPGRLQRPHDGTVSVAETQLPGLAAHCTLPVSHSGPVFSRAVEARAVQFLRDGRFEVVRKSGLVGTRVAVS